MKKKNSWQENQTLIDEVSTVGLLSFKHLSNAFSFMLSQKLRMIRDAFTDTTKKHDTLEKTRSRPGRTQ